jgi:uncharacterized LabA/DUF88 family protein
MRTSFLIDGFNLYHSLKSAEDDMVKENQGKKTTRWLNIQGLCKNHLYRIGSGATLAEVHYFSALATHMQISSPDTVSRHQTYIKCLEDTGVLTTLGRFKETSFHCRRCQKRIKRHEEKETDVAISAKLLEIFMQDTSDAVAIITGDTDLAAGVKVARRLFPTKRIGFIFPYKRKNEELATMGDFSIKLSRKSYLANQFPDPYTLYDGSKIAKPANW